MRSRSKFVFFLVAVLCLGVAGPAAADEAGSTASLEVKVDRYQAVKVFGMQVYIDQETGEMRAPTPEEAAALSTGLQQRFAFTTAGPQVVEHDNGMLSAEVDFNMLDFSVARIDGAGNLVFDCVDGAASAAALVETPASPGQEVK